MQQTDSAAFQQALSDASHIVVLQADNPDGDSLASALALENILGDLGKKVTLYCGVEIPGYLRYMDGWDRVQSDMPQQFDLSIIVDASTTTLFETASKRGELTWLKTRPCIVLDHHMESSGIDFASLTIMRETVSATELIYHLTRELQLPPSTSTAEYIAYGILSDSLGLMSEAVSDRTFLVMAELAKCGVNMAKLDNARRKLSKKSRRIVAYKGELLQRIQYSEDGRVAMIHIPWEEIESYSHEYNPSMLAIDEMRMVEDVQLAIAFKSYPDGKITAKIRANYGHAVADKIASHFGGGGHPYAAGFKLTKAQPLQEVMKQCSEISSSHLIDLEKEGSDS